MHEPWGGIAEPAYTLSNLPENHPACLEDLNIVIIISMWSISRLLVISYLNKNNLLSFATADLIFRRYFNMKPRIPLQKQISGL